MAEFLERQGLTAYALGKEIGGARMNTVYRIARRGDEPQRVDLVILAAVLDGLRRLTGEEVQIGDVLEYLPSHGNPGSG